MMQSEVRWVLLWAEDATVDVEHSLYGVKPRFGDSEEGGCRFAFLNIDLRFDGSVIDTI